MEREIVMLCDALFAVVLGIVLYSLGVIVVLLWRVLHGLNDVTPK